MLNSVAILELRNVARSTKWISSGVGLFYLAVLISRLVGALPASCGLIGLNLEMKSPPRDLMHGGPFKLNLSFDATFASGSTAGDPFSDD